MRSFKVLIFFKPKLQDSNLQTVLMPYNGISVIVEGDEGGVLGGILTIQVNMQGILTIKVTIQGLQFTTYAELFQKFRLNTN